MDLIDIVIFSFAVMFVWNWLGPYLFNSPKEIDFWTSFGIIVIIIFFKWVFTKPDKKDDND